MSIAVACPVSLSATMELSSAATISSNTFATATVKIGFKYDRAVDKNGIQRIASSSFKQGGNGLQVTSLCDGTLNAEIAITAVPQMVVDFLGGPVCLNLLS